MATRAERRWTAAEYLAFERQAEERHEFLGGEIFAMSGASRTHNRIVWNLVTLLDPQLRDRGCEGYASEMRVHIPSTGLYTYPDLAVVCGEPEFEDGELDTLLNPILLVEVLSPSTEGYDHGKKFAHYRALPSLQLYLLVAQDEVRAELFVRQADGSWLLSETTDRQATLTLPVVDVELSLDRVYDRVPGLKS